MEQQLNFEQASLLAVDDESGIRRVGTGTTMKASMAMSTNEEPTLRAEDNNRTSEYKRGFVHGERSRQLNEVPPKYLMFGIDGYALGFRAGYFADVRGPPRA